MKGMKMLLWIDNITSSECLKEAAAVLSRRRWLAKAELVKFNKISLFYEFHSLVGRIIIVFICD